MAVPLVKACRSRTARVVPPGFVLGVTALPTSGVLMKSPKEKSMRQLEKLAVQTQLGEQVDIRGGVSAQQLRPLQVSHPDQAKMLMR